MASKVILLALTLLAAALAAPGPESRMVGGTPTTIEDFPYIVSFIYYYPGPNISVQRCVGALISSFHTLTSGFCFTGANLSFMLVQAGSTYSLHGGTQSTIRDVIKHPDYIETPRTADIAVAELTFPFPLTETIQILYLPPQSTYIPDETRVKVVSWGFESESGPQLESLKTVNLYKLPLDACQEIYEDNNYVTIEDRVICASQPGPVGLCLGDSGAPMVVNDVVLGLASYYLGCGNDAYPDVFSRVDRYTNWIMEVASAPGREGINSARIAPQ